MKKALTALTMVSAAVVSLAMVAPAASAADAKGKTVYLITMDKMDQHWVNMDKGCKEAVSELGNVDYKWTAPDVKDDAKQAVTVRYSPEVLAAFRATGAGWQARMNDALKDWLRSHSPA